VTDLAAPLTDDSFYAGDPFPHYARLRAEAPVAWNEQGFWALSRHREVAQVSTSTDFSSEQGILVFEIGVTYDSPPTMMHTDPPAHTRYRGLVAPGFRPTLMKALEDSIRARTRTLLAPVEPGTPVDVVEAVAVPLPLQVIADLLGLSEEHLPRFFEWSEAAIPGATDMTDEQRSASLGEMSAFFLETIAARRSREPDDSDIIGVLAHITVDDERLTDAELLMFLIQLLVAGNETTRNLISGGLGALAAAPDQWVRLRDNPELISSGVEELLRWTSPVISFMRTAKCDVELAGVTVGAGQHVLMLYSSANRDESVFGPTAESLDVARAPNPHLAFGFGPHFCLGAALARLEGRVLLEELVDRFGTLEPAGVAIRTPSSVIAGWRTVPLVFGS
jgi:cytochrome P450